MHRVVRAVPDASVTTENPEASLKCVVAISPRRALGAILSHALESRLGVADHRAIGECAIVVHTDASAAEIRDVVAAVLEDRESAFVCEFERWSSRGAGVDAVWLGRRGH